MLPQSQQYLAAGGGGGASNANRNSIVWNNRMPAPMTPHTRLVPVDEMVRVVTQPKPLHTFTQSWPTKILQPISGLFESVKLFF